MRIKAQTSEAVLHVDHIACVGEMGLYLAKLPLAGSMALSILIEPLMVVATGYHRGITMLQATGWETIIRSGSIGSFDYSPLPAKGK